MFNIIYCFICYLINMTEHGIVFIQLLLEFCHIHFIINLKPNSFEQTNEIVLLFFFKKLKNIVLQR